METVTIDNVEYISGDYVMKHAKKYCHRIRTTRKLIEFKKIKDEDYIYAKLNNGVYIKTNGESVKFDKVFLKKSFVLTIDELNNNNKNNINDNNNNDNNNNDDNNNDNQNIVNDTINEENEINEENVVNVPNILHLNDDEKFKDDNGNPIEIETRGIREYDKIYFKVNDIERGFGLIGLVDILLHKNSTYVINRDHVIFYCPVIYGCVNKNTDKKTSKQQKNSVKKEIFLTYEGILRVLFVTRNNKTSRFIKWATQTLFTHQMGTPEQKNKLASDLLGISASIMKEVLNTDANTLPCIYLFTIGYVKDLRESMNIDHKYGDNFIIAKYGFTKDLKRRTSEHMNNYGKIKHADLKLKYYSYIDPQYISDGENDIKEFFVALNMSINYDNTKELVIIDPKLMNLIKDQYTSISRKYAGHISELITKIKEMENELENCKKQYEQSIELLKEKHTNELLQKNNELLLQKERFTNELLQKDKELLQKDKENELLKKDKENELLKKDLEIMKLMYNKCN